MSDDLLTIGCDALPDDTAVVSLVGREGLSELYGYEIAFVTQNADFDFAAAVRARATLRTHLGPDAPAPYDVHGILATVDHVHSWAGGHLFRALLVPQLWEATLTRHSRVFTDDDAGTILRKVLEGSGLSTDDFAIRLSEERQKLDLVVQYKESNFAFISRWLEREGMYFWFEQGDERELLVIADDVSFHDDQPGDAIRYVPGEENAIGGDAFETFRCRRRALPTQVELVDYDYMNPSVELVSRVPITRSGAGEVSTFGAHFATTTEGDRLATIRSQALLASEQIHTAVGRVFHVRPGYVFTLEEHPRDDFNRRYLTTGLEVRSSHALEDSKLRRLLGVDFDEEWQVTVHAIDATLQYRTPRRHEWPRVEGYEGAVVDGPADSPYAQIDAEGRYKVHIMFDEGDLDTLDDGKRSCWVRMQQPHGGGAEGFHFPLRKGTEVMLFFMGGDPDRPVIAGVVPNPQKPSPVTEQNNTQNIIVTGGLNLIEIEDQEGNQYIYVHTPSLNTYLYMGVLREEFNLTLNTEGHAHFHIGGDQVIDVDVSLTETVEADVTFNYNTNWLVNVVSDNTIEIGGELSVHVVGDVHYSFDAIWEVCVLSDTNIDISGNLDIHVGGTTIENYDNDVTINVDGDYIIDVTGNTNHTVNNNYDLTINANYTQNIISNYSLNVTANYNHIVNNTYNIEIGGSADESFWDFHIKFNGGATSDTFIGIKNENLIGGKIEAVLGLKMEAHVGVKIETKAAPNITLENVHIDNANARIESQLNKIKNHALKLDSLGIYLVF